MTTERSYFDRSQSATTFDPEEQFDADVERYLVEKRKLETEKPQND